MDPDPDKTYIKSKKKWTDFKLHQDIIEALRDDNKHKPTKVQEKALEIALNEDRKKFNLIIRAINGSGKTLAFLIPLLNSLQPGLKVAEDKNFRGKLLQNQIFRPQGVIIVQSNILQDQITNILKHFLDWGKNHESDKLKFTVGKMAKDAHVPGDIVICMAKSFLNRHSRGNMKLDQCKFVAIDEIDDIYEHEREGLAKLLEITAKQENTHTICCSATMKKEFIEFYNKQVPQFIKLNLSDQMDQEEKKKDKVTLEGVTNFYHSLKLQKDQKAQIYNYIIKVIFKHLYKETQKKKPQVFVFFNSVNQIYEFEKIFDALASDFTTEESDYLKDVTKGILAAKTYKDGKKQDLSIEDKLKIMTKFRNNETNVLLSTNIIARGVDVRNACFVINVGTPKMSDKDADVDIDIYLHRVGRTGRHNDVGVALTIGEQSEIKILVERVSKVFGLNMKQLENEEIVVKNVYECMDKNG